MPLFEQSPSETPTADSSANWYTVDRIAGIFGTSARHARRELATVSANCIRVVNAGVGRPRQEYHFCAHPRLKAWHELNVLHLGGTISASSNGSDAADPSDPSDPAPRAISPDDMAIAQFRAMAVHEYEATAKHLPKGMALAAVAEAWSRKPRQQLVTIEQRLPDGHRRKIVTCVTVGPFKARCLRDWVSIYSKASRSIAALAPDVKGKARRPQAQLPQELLTLVHAYSVSHPRANIVAGIAAARTIWPGAFPKASLGTWRRKLRALDPSKAGAALGKHGIAHFRQTQLPDVERDWTELRYNERWEIDDVELDWYAESGLDYYRFIRPKLYVIIRCSTRQWVAAVSSETDITKAQVRGLLGFAMASSQGGVPDEVVFEHGHVALDRTLEQLLDVLCVKHPRISMDSGHTHELAFPDVSRGNPKGHGLNEAGNRRIHIYGANIPGQVGGDERNTKTANFENFKRWAAALAKEGKNLVVPRNQDIPAIVRGILEKCNNAPHTAHPMIIDPETGEKRHMTPNEMAVQKRHEGIRVLDPRLLSQFYQVGSRVEVTRNGFKLNNHWYGRMDPDLLNRVGAFVDAYAMPDYPAIAYVTQLARCVEMYEKESLKSKAGYANKIAREKVLRNKHEELLSRAMATEKTLIAECAQTTANPVPDRPAIVFGPQVLLERAAALEGAAVVHKAEAIAAATELDSKFDLAATPAEASAPAARAPSSLKDQLSDFRSQLEALGGGSNHNAPTTTEDTQP